MTGFLKEKKRGTETKRQKQKGECSGSQHSILVRIERKRENGLKGGFLGQRPREIKKLRDKKRKTQINASEGKFSVCICVEKDGREGRMFWK